MATKVRQAPVYALYEPSKTTAVRQMAVYALVGDFSPLPRNVTGKRAVFDMIQSQTDQVLDLNAIVLGLPEPTTEFDRNTKVLVTGVEGRGLNGSMYFYYNRATFKQFYLPASFLIQGEADVYSLLPRLSIASETPLVESDVLNTAVVSGKVAMTAAVDSYFFLPGSVLNLVSSH